MKKSLVITSQNSPDGLLCVDVFQRQDGSFGFEEFRRDPEDASGWYAVGGFNALRFETAYDADRDAADRVSWFGTD
ncbi:hypothetical protein [Nisaea sp.]|uniref:hypothetical protein n=1 Tax=Nisaea sp. TaxID=2024842 RepID=UPI003265589A